MGFRVASFNIQHGLTAIGDRVDIDRTAAACAALDADVLALQEVDVGVARSDRADQAAVIAEACGARYVFGAAARVGMGGRYGNALIVRGEIGDHRVVKLPHGRHHEPRAAIVATVAAGPSRLAVVATHLSIHRPEVFEQLRRVVDLVDPRPPALLIGDLNLNLAEVEPVTTRAGLVLAEGPPTFPAADPTARIDHVAVKGLRLGRVGVPATASSDHRPLVVELD